MEPSPKKPSLFQASPSYGNVVLNFLHTADRELGLYAQAFHEAGQVLAERMFAHGGYSDLEACPIVFLYRHSLELYLKAIVLIGCDIMQRHGETLTDKERLFGNHRLLHLLPLIKRTFDAVGWTWHEDIEGLRTFEEVGELLQAFEKIDPGSYTFRYPVNTKGQPSVPHHFTFHMPTFCECMDAFLNMLEAAVMGLKVARDQIMEAAYHEQNNTDITYEESIDIE